MRGAGWMDGCDADVLYSPLLSSPLLCSTPLRTSILSIHSINVSSVSFPCCLLLIDHSLLLAVCCSLSVACCLLPYLSSFLHYIYNIRFPHFVYFVHSPHIDGSWIVDRLPPPSTAERFAFIVDLSLYSLTHGLFTSPVRPFVGCI